MALPIVFNNTVYQSGTVGTDDGAPSASFGIDDTSQSSITVNGTVNAVGDPVTVTGILPGTTTSTTRTFYATQFDNSGAIEFNDTRTNPNSNSTRLVLSNTQLGTRFTADGNGTLGDYAGPPPCYVTGTLIRTARGEVAVEALAVGDLVVTASGQHRPVVWIGSRRVAFADRPASEASLPVRIRAGAVAPGVPARDLLVSPDHSLFFDDVFVPAKHLVNGASVTRETVAAVTYWHVELDSHDVLLAEGMPAESYLDVGNRGNFQNGRGAGDHGGRAGQDFCAPVVRGGDHLRNLRTWLNGRAHHLGWQVSLEPEVQLVADGAALTPTAAADGRFRFDIPPGTSDLRLVSRTGILSEILAEHPDERRLGVMLTRLTLDGQDVRLDDERLSGGFHAFEPGADWRWTRGEAQLPVAARVEFQVRPAVYIVDAARPAATHRSAPRLRLVG